jgi:hypothetical protein
MRQELLAARSPVTCVHCSSAIPDGMRAWWDLDERVWTCTQCVPTDESAAHSVGYTTAHARAGNRQKIAAASFLR